MSGAGCNITKEDGPIIFASFVCFLSFVGDGYWILKIVYIHGIEQYMEHAHQY